MKWAKRGFICSSETFDLGWYRKNTMVPVPLLLGQDCLRIYLTMCDDQNVGRIGYVDVDPKSPTRILNYSREPVLDVGADGHFDDSGVLPSAIFSKEGNNYMLYSAYQRHVKVPYSILTGIAKFDDFDFSKLHRLSEIPVLERSSSEQFIRSAPFCFEDDGTFVLYYSSGTSWIDNNRKRAPTYDIKCVRSRNFCDWSRAEPEPCLSLQGDEYGLTTPAVWHDGEIYKMTYSIRSISKGYRLGYAESPDFAPVDTYGQPDGNRPFSSRVGQRNALLR